MPTPIPVQPYSATPLDSTGWSNGLYIKLANNTYQPIVDADGYFAYTRNCVLQAPGLEIVGGSASALVDNANSFQIRQSDTFSIPVSATATFPTLDTAVYADGTTAGDLAFDNGTVPPNTLSCRMYTFMASVNPTTAVVTLSVVAGADFTKHRPANTGDICLGDPSLAIVGYLYVKNESAAPFVPGTTHLDATGITSHFTDQFGFLVL